MSVSTNTTIQGKNKWIFFPYSSNIQALAHYNSTSPSLYSQENTMRLRGTDFAPIANASGARGFFGEGYWYHKPWKLFRGLSFNNWGFVAKTTTLGETEGNMPMKKDGITPKEWLPNCIFVKLKSGVVLNAVGLSGPGAQKLLQAGRWQTLDKPFFLSFMSLAKTKADRLEELNEFCGLLFHYLPPHDHPYGLELNFSCPTSGHDLGELVNEIGESLDIAGCLGVPLAIKVNALAAPERIAEIGKHQELDCLIMGNTIPWLELTDQIDYRELFGTTVSPLESRKLNKKAKGGLSGPPLLPIHCAYIQNLRDCGYSKPIYGCGGIRSRNGVVSYFNAGANGIEVGSAVITTPGNTKEMAQAAYELF